MGCGAEKSRVCKVAQFRQFRHPSDLHALCKNAVSGQRLQEFLGLGGWRCRSEG